MNFDGSESVPDLNKATFLAFDDKAVPIDGSFIAEWRYPSGVVTRRIANRQGHTNIIFKMKLDPVPAGSACTLCWGTDKPFGTGGTPSTVTVVIENVEKGPDWQPGFGEPPNGAFEFAQQGGIPCRYIFGNAEFDMSLNFGPVSPEIDVLSLIIFSSAFFASGDNCQAFYENEVTDFFINGTATIFVPPVE